VPPTVQFAVPPEKGTGKPEKEYIFSLSHQARPQNAPSTMLVSQFTVAKGHTQVVDQQSFYDRRRESLLDRLLGQTYVVKTISNRVSVSKSAVNLKNIFIIFFSFR
jgi:hypothetical protein